MTTANKKTPLALTAALLLGVGCSLVWNYGNAPTPAPAKSPVSLPVNPVKMVHTPTELTAASPFGDFKTGKLLPPNLPRLPGLPGNIAKPGREYELLGLLPPDLVVVKSGSKTLTLRCNADSELGYVGRIEDRGVYINGQYLVLDAPKHKKK